MEKLNLMSPQEKEFILRNTRNQMMDNINSYIKKRSLNKADPEEFKFSTSELKREKLFDFNEGVIKKKTKAKKNFTQKSKTYFESPDPPKIDISVRHQSEQPLQFHRVNIKRGLTNLSSPWILEKVKKFYKFNYSDEEKEKGSKIVNEFLSKEIRVDNIIRSRTNKDKNLFTKLDGYKSKSKSNLISLRAYSGEIFNKKKKRNSIVGPLKRTDKNKIRINIDKFAKVYDNVTPSPAEQNLLIKPNTLNKFPANINDQLNNKTSTVLKKPNLNASQTPKTGNKHSDSPLISKSLFNNNNDLSIQNFKSLNLNNITVKSPKSETVKPTSILKDKLNERSKVSSNKSINRKLITTNTFKPINKTESLKSKSSITNKLDKPTNNQELIRKLSIKKKVYDSQSDDEELQDEKENNRFYLDTNSRWKSLFDIHLCLGYVIGNFLSPFKLAFPLCVNGYIKFFLVMDIIIDIFFVLDCVLSFFWAYYNYYDEYVTNLRKIVQNYINSWLFLDLITGVPFNTILTLRNNYYLDGDPYELNHLQSSFINLLCLNRCVKFYKIEKSREMTVTKYTDNFLCLILNNELGRLGKFCFYLFFACHLFSCVWIFLAYTDNPNWVSYYGFDSYDYLSLYVSSLYFNLLTIFTIGYGDFTYVSLAELVFNIILLTFGIVIYTYLISNVSNIVKSTDQCKAKYLFDLNYLENARIQYELPRKLYMRVKNFLDNNFLHQKLDKNYLIKDLPSASIKNDLTCIVFQDLINSFKLFKHIKVYDRSKRYTLNSPEFAVRVLTCLKSMQLKKDELLIEQGEYFEELIIIKRGMLSIEKIHRGNVIKLINLHRGEHFGEMFMILNEKSAYRLRVRSKRAQIYMMKKIDMIKISDEFPEIFKKIYRETTYNMLVLNTLTENVIVDLDVEIDKEIKINTESISSNSKIYITPTRSNYVTSQLQNEFYSSESNDLAFDNITENLNSLNENYRLNDSLNIIDEKEEEYDEDDDCKSSKLYLKSPKHTKSKPFFNKHKEEIEINKRRQSIGDSFMKFSSPIADLVKQSKTLHYLKLTDPSSSKHSNENVINFNFNIKNDIVINSHREFNKAELLKLNNDIIEEQIRRFGDNKLSLKESADKPNLLNKSNLDQSGEGDRSKDDCEIQFKHRSSPQPHNISSSDTLYEVKNRISARSINTCKDSPCDTKKEFNSNDEIRPQSDFQIKLVDNSIAKRNTKEDPNESSYFMSIKENDNSSIQSSKRFCFNLEKNNTSMNDMIKKKSLDRFNSNHSDLINNFKFGRKNTYHRNESASQFSKSRILKEYEYFHSSEDSEINDECPKSDNRIALNYEKKKSRKAISQTPATKPRTYSNEKYNIGSANNKIRKTATSASESINLRRNISLTETKRKDKKNSTIATFKNESIHVSPFTTSKKINTVLTKGIKPFNSLKDKNTRNFNRSNSKYTSDLSTKERQMLRRKTIFMVDEMNRNVASNNQNILNPKDYYSDFFSKVINKNQVETDKLESTQLKAMDQIINEIKTYVKCLKGN